MSPLASSSNTDDERDHHRQLQHNHEHEHEHDSLDHLHDQVLEPLDQDLNSVLSEAAQVEAALLLHHHRFATLGSIPHHQDEHSHEHQYTIDHTGIVENYPSASGVDSVGVDESAFRDMEQEHHHDDSDIHHHHHLHHHHDHDHLDAYASAEGNITDQTDLPREMVTGEVDKDELGAYPSHELDNQPTELSEDGLGLDPVRHSQELELSIENSSENLPPKKKLRRVGPKGSPISLNAGEHSDNGNGQAVAGPSSVAIQGLAGLHNESSSAGIDKPVRKKGRVQVSNACTNCQKSRKKCSGDRPCTNCIGHPERVCENSSRTARAKGIKRGPYKKKDRSDPRHLQNFPHIQSTYDLYHPNPESTTPDSHHSGSNSLSGSPNPNSSINLGHHSSNPGAHSNDLAVSSAGQAHHSSSTYESYDVSDGSRATYSQIDMNGGQGGFALVSSEDLNSQLIPLSLPSDHLSLNEDSPMGQSSPPPPPGNRSFLERLKEDVFGRKALMAATAAAALTSSSSGGSLLDPRLTSSAAHLDHDLLVSLANLPQEADQSVSRDEHHHHSGLSLDSLQEAQALSATVAESRQAAEAEAVVALSRRLEMDLAHDQNQDQDQVLNLEGQGQEAQEVTE